MVHLRTLPLSLRVLAKSELFRIWLLGRAMHAIGMIGVDRDSPTSASTATVHVTLGQLPGSLTVTARSRATDGPGK